MGNKLYYCVGCNEAVETNDFITEVGYDGMFYSHPNRYRPLAFCVNEAWPYYPTRYDEDGKMMHTPSPTSKTYYSCSNNHSWSETS